MGRFRDIINNSTYGRAAHGNVRPLAIQMLGNALMPGVGSLLSNLYTRYEDRRDRRNNVAFSPSPEMAADSTGSTVRDALGLMNWGGHASAPGQYGPMANGYAGLSPTTGAQNPGYDEDYASNLVAGYLGADPNTGGQRESGGHGGSGSFGIGPNGAHGALAASAAANGIGAAMASRIGSMMMTDTGTMRPHHNRFSDKTNQK